LLHSLEYKPQGQLAVKIVQIAEPSKFRTLSKGDGELYSAVQPTQGQMLSCWKRHPASTMKFADLTAKVQKIYDSTPKEWKWVSVDYSQATDTLKGWTTRAAMWGAVNLHDPTLAFYSLMPGFLVYSDAEGYANEILTQTDGQLMGHPLSFPLLCIINLSVYLEAIRRFADFGKCSRVRKERLVFEESARVLRRNVIINGDDEAFRAPESFLPFFWEVVAEAGLKKSVGKNYISSHTVSINSQWFQLKGTSQMKRIGYLNLTLVLGLSLKTGQSKASPVEIGREISSMISLCRWSKSTIPLTFKRFDDARNKGNYWFQPNWYLPVHLGGYGVDIAYAPDNWTISRAQRKIAARFVCPNSKLALFTRLKQKHSLKFASHFLGKFVIKPVTDCSDYERLQDIDDDWLARINLAYYLHDPPKNVESDDALLPYVASRFPLHSRLSPMSDRKIAEYWNVKFISSAPPVCPPLSIIRQKTHTLVRDDGVSLTLKDGLSFHQRSVLSAQLLENFQVAGAVRRYLLGQGDFPDVSGCVSNGVL